MSTQNADLLRILGDQATVSGALRQRQFGFATDTEKIIVRDESDNYYTIGGSVTNNYGIIEGLTGVITANYIPKAISESELADSIMHEEDDAVNVSGKTNINTGSPGIVNADPMADNLVIKDSNYPGISLLGSNGGAGSIYFGNTTNSGIGRILYTYSTNDMGFYTNDTMRMHIQEDGKTAIGNSAPDGTLHIYTAEAGSVTANANADDLVIENSTTGGLSILTPSGDIGVLMFGNDRTNNAASIEYEDTTLSMYFNVNNSSRLSIVDDDVFTDEWQSYTPTVSGWGGSPTLNFKYKTIGKLVFLKYSIQGSGNADATKFTLPIEVESETIVGSPNAIGYDDVYGYGCSYAESGWIFTALGSWAAAWKYNPAENTTELNYGDGMSNKWLCGQFWYQSV